MDLNCLYHRRGVSLQMADRASCISSRVAHLELAARYAKQIAAAKTMGSVVA